MTAKAHPMLASTYSIVARDPETGDLGVAVQSSYFSVGTDVTWAEPGVGAIATQSIVEKAYGPKGLAALAHGMTPADALKHLTSLDSASALRQVGMVDADGRVAAHTGVACVPARGQILGEEFSVQGNMLASDDVWRAMAPAFRRAEGDLAERLVAVLEQAEQAGGDMRGKQSAALLVVSGDRVEKPWDGVKFDIHVSDSPEPLRELRRLLTIRRAHTLFEDARMAVAAGELDRGIALVEAARNLHPNEVQFTFWTGIALANAGRRDEARSWLREAFDESEVWRELGRRLALVGMFSGDPDLLET